MEEYKEIILRATTPGPIDGMLMEMATTMGESFEVQHTVGMLPLKTLRLLHASVEGQLEGFSEMNSEDPHHDVVAGCLKRILEAVEEAIDLSLEAIVDTVEQVSSCRCTKCQAANADMN